MAPLTKKCDWCENSIAIVSCAGCQDNKLLCQGCNDFVHLKGERATHIRTPLGFSDHSVERDETEECARSDSRVDHSEGSSDDNESASDEASDDSDVMSGADDSSEHDDDSSEHDDDDCEDKNDSDSSEDNDDNSEENIQESEDDQNLDGDASDEKETPREQKKDWGEFFVGDDHCQLTTYLQKRRSRQPKSKSVRNEHPTRNERRTRSKRAPQKKRKRCVNNRVRSYSVFLLPSLSLRLLYVYL